jgi:hypothetical protein
MACCCQKTLDFCRQDVCANGVLTLPFTAPEQGMYQLIVEFLNGTYAIGNPLAVGAPITFNITGLNEFYEYQARVRKPDGSFMEFVLEGNPDIFDCIQFTTTMLFDSSPVFTEAQLAMA